MGRTRTRKENRIGTCFTHFSRVAERLTISSPSLVNPHHHPPPRPRPCEIAELRSWGTTPVYRLGRPLMDRRPWPPVQARPWLLGKGLPFQADYACRLALAIWPVPPLPADPTSIKHQASSIDSCCSDIISYLYIHLYARSQVKHTIKSTCNRLITQYTRHLNIGISTRLRRPSRPLSP